ncbi:MAG: hypothetical protein RTU63_07100 [Candidatus Thorarchaeota archaeon]
MSKIRIVALLVSAILFLGMSTMSAVASTPGTFPVTFEDNIADWEYMLVGTIELEFDDEVSFLLTVEEVLPDTDLDIEVYFGDELVFWLATGYGYIGDPEIIEQGYFWVPYSGTYEIWMFGYWVPYEEGVDFTLVVDSAEELYDCPPLEAHGLSVGALTSYVNNNPNAMGASEKAPFHDVDGAYEATHINHVASFNTNSWTEYTIDPMRYCSDDAIIVGGWVDGAPASWFSSFKEAKDYMCSIDFVHYIDGVPLTELAKVKTGTVQKVFQDGEVVSYRKVLETAIFHPGELAEAIGEGLHRVDMHYVGPDFIYEWVYYFWLMPEGWTGPH